MDLKGQRRHWKEKSAAFDWRTSASTRPERQGGAGNGGRGKSDKWERNGGRGRRGGALCPKRKAHKFPVLLKQFFRLPPTRYPARVGPKLLR